MEPMARFRSEHAWIRREMDGIEALLSGDIFDRPEELRERLRALWIFLLRHERLEEEWMAGDWMTPPAALPDREREMSHREHGDIISVLGSLGEVMARFDGPYHGGPMPLADRQAVLATIEGLFRFVREHLEREDREILGRSMDGTRPAVASRHS